MYEAAAPPQPRLGRAVRAQEVHAGESDAAADAISRVYRDELDVVVVRAAFDAEALRRAGERLDAGAWRWSRPNESMPPEDVQLIGTDTPATPTYSAPRGASLEAYLASAAAHAGDTRAAFDAAFDAAAAVHAAIARVAGGRPVRVAQAADGRAYAPFTIRRLIEGKQIGLHHDFHWGLDLYRELARQVDTSTLVSFVAALRTPLEGGELIVYGATSDDAAVPRLANGFSYDLGAVEARYRRVSIALRPGDMFLLAAGRCLHRVERVVGPCARITMGGFLALDLAREQVLYWS